MDLIGDYVAERRLMCWTVETVRLRTWQLRSFAESLPYPLPQATRADVIGWLIVHGDSPSTRRSCISGLRGHFQWLIARGIITDDPTGDLIKPKSPRAIPRPLPDDLFRDALAYADPRTTAMLVWARFAGLRCGEIGAAQSTWLIGPNIIVPGKGDNIDPVPAHPLVAAQFRAARGHLFPSRGGRSSVGHLTANTITKLGNKHLARHAHGWTMHSLRHAFGTEVYELSRDLGVTQTAMRHASPLTTRGYALLSDTRIREAVLSLAA